MGQEVNNCVFCTIADGSTQSATIYEDDAIICVLDIFPASKGHVLVIPKEHVVFSTQMSDDLSKRVFVAANKIAGVVFEVMKSEGTNIVVSNGAVAGQKIGHAVVHVIPRYKDDTVKIEFGGKPITQEELQDTLSKLQSKVNLQITEKKKEPVVIKEEIEESDDSFEERRP